MTKAVAPTKEQSIKNLGSMIESWLNFIRVAPKTANTYRIAIRQ